MNGRKKEQELTHSEKFIQITNEYEHIFVDAENFKNLLKHKRPTSVWNWLYGINPNSISRAKICEIFGLRADVWKEYFDDSQKFRKALKGFQIITQNSYVESSVDELIIDSTSTITEKEQKMLEEEKSMDLENEIKDKSPDFMFKLAKKLKKETKIVEALKVIEMIEKHPSTYKYTYYNELEHFKAILLSHDDIKDWDRAIDILKRLYSGAKYHLVEPEIITLIASNYKRKALYDEEKKELRAKEDIDMDLLVSALTLYKEAYRQKDSKIKYYDAVNFAYLYNIMDIIEPEDANPREIKDLYDELMKVWKIDKNDWWEFISYTEFLMLTNQTDSAILEIDDFLKNNLHSISEFMIETTLRQLNLYIHFTKDKNAIRFSKNLQKSWESLKKYF